VTSLSRARAIWLAGLVHLAATLIMTWPYVNWAAPHSAIYAGDARFIAWLISWNSHAWINGLPVFDANVFYPASGALVYNDPLFGLSIFALPIQALGGSPILSYTLLTVAAFLLNGLAMQTLARRLTGDGVASVVAGFIYAFSFYMMLHGHGHLSQIWVWPLPLSLWAFDRWLETPRWRHALLWGGLLLLQVLSSWYLAIIALVGTVVVVAWNLPGMSRDHLRRRAVQVVLVAGLSAAVVWPLVAPYRANPAPTTASELAGNSADWASYLVPPVNTVGGQWWIRTINSAPRWIWGEQTLFLGYLALGLALAGVGRLAWHRGRGRVTPYVLTAAAGVALSFGPADVAGGWPSLLDLLRVLPGVDGIRSPGRFAILVLLGTGVLAAFAVAGMRARWGRRADVCLALLMPLMLAEWYVIDFPAGKPPQVELPAIYRHPAIASARGLASLPDYRSTERWFDGADYLLYSTVHWRPIVNGFGRAEPPGHPRVISYLRAFPGPNNARLMRELGVDLIVFHAARYGPGADVIVADAMALPDYELIGQEANDYLFRVRARP
jgi:hypothetical protein